MNNQEVYYLGDNRLYLFWKLINGERLVGRNKIRFEDFIVPDEHQAISAIFLCLELKMRNLHLDGLTFHKDLYQKYSPREYEALLKKIENEPELGFSKSAKNILNGSFTVEDMEMCLMLLSFDMVEWFEFDTKLPAKTKKVMQDYVMEYIEKFIDNDLQIESSNYLNFENHKEKFFKELKDSYLNNYPNTFVYTRQSLALPEWEADYLFIHMIVALEKLNYLQIKGIWVFDIDLPPEKQTENFKVKITVTDKLRIEVNEMFGKAQNKTSDQNKFSLTTFNAQTSVLLFQDKDIVIAKSKNTNPHYLLNTLFKEKAKIWSYDEIADDWNELYSKNDWKRYYYAGYSVNEKIEKKTGISDFLEITNKNISIKGKYL